MTRYRDWSLGCRVSLLAITCATCGWAAPALRKQVDLHGDFVLFGNTLGWDCGPDVPAPLVGTVNCGGVANISDSGIDLFWSSDASTATASSAVTAPSSTAVLALPSGARVSYARLYWGAYRTGATRAVDATATIDRPLTAYSQTVTALSDSQWTVAVPGMPNQYWYQASADITDLLQSAGTGPYRVSDITAERGTSSEVSMAGWAVVVFYETRRRHST